MKTYTSLPIPPPVNIAGLKFFFKTTYQLGETQVELMLQSSRISMGKILGEAERALQSEDACVQLKNVGHSLKGLMLNMGESQWADVARELENSAKAGEVRDYAAIIDTIRVGMAAVLGYGEIS